ncbi:MAG TPA: protein kinase, partial [Gemmataceae bacterium]|nr:protein kinase [Gemmataceae bacterium]
MPVELSCWIGRTLASDRYRVTAKLGEGGMGFVFQAVDRHLERDVVIKVPRRDVLEDPAFTGRFQREIRSLVRLAHPHIVKVLDVGEADGLPFAVLQYLSGGSLASRINPGVPVTVRVKKVQDWLAQIAAALDFMHSQGYIHRDVKPDNILFDAPGNVFLSDFGIAKVVAESRSAGTQTLRTQTGVVLGTPQYMAPELIMGQPHDGRVDQYALAIVVYEMLSGVLPITGPTPAAILVEQTLKQPVALDELVPDFPQGVAAAVHKALAKNAGDRYPDCATFARAVLAAAAVGTGADARPAGTRQVSSPFGVAQPPVALPVERAPETARIARTFADWHASPNPATPVPRAPWTAKNKRDVEDSGERRRLRASRAQKRKKIAYLIIACSLGIVVLGSGISVAIILANSASQTAAKTAPVQEPVPEPVATATAAPAIAQPEPLADAQPEPPLIDKRTKTGVLEVGDYRVRVVHLRPEGQRLLVELQIENQGAKTASPLSPWDKDGNVPRLGDRGGNNFAWIPSAGQDTSRLALEPRKQRGLALYFDLPPADVEALNLELPAAVFGRAGRLGFDLRDDMLLFLTARFRKSKAVPGLREALASAEPGRRAAAARALGETGPAAAAAVRELVDRLNEDTPVVRAAAAQALGQIGPAAGEARSALARALSDPDAQVGALAAKALKLLPAPAAEDIGDLRRALREQNPKVRAYALEALKGVGPAAQRALPEILQALKDRDPALRTVAAGILGTIADDEAITALAEARKDPEVTV